MNLELTSSPTVLLIKSFLLDLKGGKFLSSSSPNEPSTFFCQHFIIFLGFFFFFLTVGDNQSFEMNSYIYIYSQIYVVPYVPGVQYKVLSDSSNKLP